MLILISILIFTCSPAKVVDLAGNYTLNNFACLKSNGIERSIIRAYHSYGKIDLDAQSNIFNSNKAGLSTDLYMFPCRGRNATQQVYELVDYITSMKSSDSLYSFNTGTIWIDIETNPSTGCSWSIGTYESNCLYLKELISAFDEEQRIVGIYASHYMWTQIFGEAEACPLFVDRPLWYAHYDFKESFDDWSANKFGGWSEPTLKQFTDREEICGLKVDESYY